VLAGPGGDEDDQQIELTILMPCLNEAETVARCVGKARRFLDEQGVIGEVLVADNGSTDGSAELAVAAGARVVTVPLRGNGAALHGGIRAARGRYVIMGDADDSYDFLKLEPFLYELRAGADLVMGNRFRGGIAPGAMPGLHRYLGNPLFTWMGRLFFGSTVGDFHCGLRGFRRDKLDQLGMSSLGFEFCSEMVIKASLHGWRVTEVPTTLAVDGRSRAPHLRTWHDGLRHLRFFLLYSPRWLFWYPGLTVLVVGALFGASVATDPNGFTVLGVNFDVDSLVAAAGMVIVGVQATVFAALTKVYAAAEGFLPAGPWTRRAQRLRLEWGLLVGALLFVIGMAGMVVSLSHWHGANFGTVDPRVELRMVVPSVTAVVVGVQVIAASLFVSILGIRHEAAHVETFEYTVAAEPPA
jgi:hypothetical protein